MLFTVGGQVGSGLPSKPCHAICLTMALFFCDDVSISSFVFRRSFLLVVFLLVRLGLLPVSIAGVGGPLISVRDVDADEMAS